MSKEKFANSLDQLRKALKKQEQIIAIKCNHQKKNGDLNVKWVDEANGVVECKTCGDRFSMAIYSEDQASRAIFVVHSMIQQMRGATNANESDIVENYGKIDFALKQIPEKYLDLVDALGKNKKKKKKKNKGSNIGGYGDALAVVRRNRNNRK